MPPAHPEFTVSSLTSALKRTIEGGFSKVVVEGEVSGWKRYPSGHCYFTLKDEGAQISAVMFAGQYESSCKRHPELAAGLKDGAKIKVFGNVTVYPPRGNYQIVVLSAMLAGLGDLMQKYLELKAKLEGEGLFNTARKRSLPAMPRRIGIVTSEAGAVIHDMCTVLTRRFPNLEIRLFPAQVQGAALSTSTARTATSSRTCSSSRAAAAASRTFSASTTKRSSALSRHRRFRRFPPSATRPTTLSATLRQTSAPGLRQSPPRSQFPFLPTCARSLRR